MDLLVDFEPIDHDTFDYVGNYFDLKDSLERLFNRKVDLIEYGKNLNPIFKALVDKKKQLIYGWLYSRLYLIAEYGISPETIGQ